MKKFLVYFVASLAAQILLFVFSNLFNFPALIVPHQIVMALLMALFGSGIESIEPDQRAVLGYFFFIPFALFSVVIGFLPVIVGLVIRRPER